MPTTIRTSRLAELLDFAGLQTLRRSRSPARPHALGSILNRESISERKAFLLFSILGAISLAIWFRPLMTSLVLALRDDKYTHLFLILPVSFALISLDWRWSESSTKSSANYGIGLLALAAVVTVLARVSFAASHSGEQLSLNMLALVLWWIGAFIVCFGTSAFKHALFPLGFLFWLIPFPSFILNPIVRLLEQGSAASAHFLLWIVRVPVEQTGMLITIPGLTLEVAPECSSIRSSLMLMVTTMVLAQVLLRSPWRKLLVIAVAFPLSVAKNGLRIFVLVMAGTRVDPGYLTGRLHRKGGIIYFLIALAIIFVFLWVARRGEQKPRLLPASDP
jgi:exosortase